MKQWSRHPKPYLWLPCLIQSLHFFGKPTLTIYSFHKYFLAAYFESRIVLGGGGRSAKERHSFWSSGVSSLVEETDIKQVITVINGMTGKHVALREC